MKHDHAHHGHHSHRQHAAHEHGDVRSKTLIDACPGHGELERCPIVAALSGEDRP